MFRIFAILIGYAFGAIQTAYILGKLKGIDIREHGSGNAGTTNTMRVLGTKAGLIVFLGDCLKCIAAILLSWFLFKDSNPDYGYLIKLYAGLGAILGHNFPFYLGFHGGKGVACTAGMIISFDPWFMLAGIIIFFSIFFATHYVSLGSLCIYPYFLLMEIILGQNGYFGDVGLIQPVLYEMYALTFGLLVLTSVMHRKNISRLLQHNEKKTYLSSKAKEKYLKEQSNG